MRAPGFYFQPPGLASALLSPFGTIYGVVAAARMRRPGARAGVPVICVGNPTLGGAGKTPAALALAQMLAAMSERPFFLSRGYGGSEAGPLLVDPARYTAAEVGARDRVAGAKLAVEQGASVLVLDDGFQNPSLVKDCALLVVDRTRGIGNGRMFPAGPLRAPLDVQLALAQGIVLVGDGDAANFVAKRAAAFKLPLFPAKLIPDAAAAAKFSGKKLLAFAGIGHPEKFFATLAALGADVAETRSFPDHHRYSVREAQSLVSDANARGLTLVTTEKDLVRMQGDPALAELAASFHVLPVRLQFEDEDAVRDLLKRTLVKARA